jgi:hypothetical protein
MAKVDVKVLSSEKKRPNKRGNPLLKNYIQIYAHSVALSSCFHLETIPIVVTEKSYQLCFLQVNEFIV